MTHVRQQVVDDLANDTQVQQFHLKTNSTNQVDLYRWPWGLGRREWITSEIEFDDTIDTLRRSTGGKSVSCVEMRGNRSNGQLGRVGYRLRMWRWWRLANGRDVATAPDESYLDPWLFPAFSHPTTNRRLLLRRWTTSKLVKRPAKQGHLADQWSALTVPQVGFVANLIREKKQRNAQWKRYRHRSRHRRFSILFE